MFVLSFPSKCLHSQSFHRSLASKAIKKPGDILERIDKILSHRGFGSRKEASHLLLTGKVKYNGEIIRKFSKQIPSNAILEVNREISKPIPTFALFNKPLTMLSTVGDPMKRLNLQDLYDRYAFLKTFHPVGRLDAMTTGLLVFSRDGDLTNLLLDPKSEIPREYEAIVSGRVNSEKLSQQLKEGIETSLGSFTGKLLHSLLPEQIKFPIDKSFVIQHSQEEKIFETNYIFSYVRLSVTEGKYHMIRRMLFNAGYPVIALHRCQYGLFTVNPPSTSTPLIEELKQWPPTSMILPNEIYICENDGETNWIYDYNNKQKK